ncbi:MAG: magnesium transporter [Desulfofustis sp.]|nr:magnesium transporter [Desulfofustis sp.]
MSQKPDERPWDDLIELIDAKQPEGIIAAIDAIPEREIALILSRLDDEDRNWLLTLLDPSDAAGLLEDISDEQAAHILSELSPDDAGRILDELPQDQAVDVLSELDEADAEDILQSMPPESADSARELLNYPKDTAGHLMITEVLYYRDSLSIGDVNQDLQKKQDLYRSYHIQYIYVIDANHCLVGVMRIHDLLFSSKSSLLRDVMIGNPISVNGNATLDEISDAFAQHSLLALPVVDDAGILLGIVLPVAVEEAKRKRTVKHFLWLSGIVGGEEFRSMPLYKRSGRRLSWLTLNIALNIIAASVIALYQETLAAAIALAVFLPMVSDMSGCSGNQAVAVSLRELALGLLRPGEILRVAYKESTLGLINGVLLGILLGIVAYLWKGNIFLSLVIGVALAGNTLVAVTVGGMLPLLLKRLKIDPALVSSPLLTTVTDMCGFFLVLSLASTVLPRISV